MEINWNIESTIIFEYDWNVESTTIIERLLLITIIIVPIVVSASGLGYSEKLRPTSQEAFTWLSDQGPHIESRETYYE